MLTNVNILVGFGLDDRWGRIGSVINPRSGCRELATDKPLLVSEAHHLETYALGALFGFMRAFELPVRRRGLSICTELCGSRGAAHGCTGQCRIEAL